MKYPIPDAVEANRKLESSWDRQKDEIAAHNKKVEDRLRTVNASFDASERR